jgi:small-conductance mechanosensitive channel
MLLVVLFVAGTAGCHNSHDRTKAGDRARSEVSSAERKAADASSRRELERPLVRGSDRNLEDLQEAAEEIRREREDVAEAAARERSQYKKTLSKEIGSIDKRVGELEQELARATGTAKNGKERDISAARGWRARLKQDLDELERVGESDWPDVKDRIDHDLEDERPTVVPRSLDKSYAI